MNQIEQIGDTENAATAGSARAAFFGEGETENAKHSFINGFFVTLGAGAATGVLAILSVVAHTLMSSGGKDQGRS